MHSKDLSILFVEDNAKQRDEITSFLQTTLFQKVYVARNGEEGLAHFRAHKPDIVLTDLTMPIMSGLEMSKKIKEINPNTPILLVTSHFEKEVTEAAVDIGIDGYLFKPLLLERVEKILNKYKERILQKRELTQKREAQATYLQSRVDEEVAKNITLHNEREAQRLREEKFFIIGKMAAGITHEINTPLTYIKGNLELMMDDIKALDESVAQKNYLREGGAIILEGINRISSIVESMREIASQAKEMPAESNIYASLVTSLILSYNKGAPITLQNEPFKITMDKNRHIFKAPIQKQRIEQVFIIIINNAMDALKATHIFEERKLAITLQEKGDFIVVCFQDNGGGISKEMLPKIFDPFQSSKTEGGIGIGLNVAKRIIHDHGGEIEAYNHNDGALFEVSIPKKLKITLDA